MKKATSYFKKHIVYTSLVHVIGGIGIGMLIASPVAGIHPVPWGDRFTSN